MYFRFSLKADLQCHGLVCGVPSAEVTNAKVSKEGALDVHDPPGWDTYTFIEGSAITESLSWEHYHQLHQIVMSEH